MGLRSLLAHNTEWYHSGRSHSETVNAGRGQACQEGQSSLKDEEVEGSRLCLVALVRGKPLSEPGVI